MYYLMNDMKFYIGQEVKFRTEYRKKHPTKTKSWSGTKKRRRTVETSEKTVRRRERYTRRDAM